jgi:hypothetical protein
MTIFRTPPDVEEAQHEAMKDDMDFSDWGPIVHLPPPKDGLMFGHKIEYWKKLIKHESYISDY